MSTQPPDFHQPHPTRSEPPQPRLQQGWSAPQAEPGTLNVLGILALGVQVVSALLTAVSPIFYRTADNIAAASTMFAIVSIGMLLLTIVLGLCVGVTMDGNSFLKLGTIKILVLGCLAFAFSTAGGVLLGKVMARMPGSPVNPLIGAAGVSAVPMAARVAHNLGQEADPDNYLLMYAMGPNVAGVIGTAIAAGSLLALLR